MKTPKFLFALLLAAHVTWAHAAAILSECPVVATDSKDGKQIIDRYRPSDNRLALRSFSKNFAEAFYYLSRLYSARLTPTERTHELSELEDMYEDVQMTMVLKSPADSCHGANNPKTIPYAVIPFAKREKGPDGKHLVVFRACEYLVDETRQLLFDQDCKLIGRPSGYSFTEMNTRFETLKAHLARARDDAKIFAGGVAIVSFFGVFRGLKIVRAPALASLSVAMAPPAFIYFSVASGFLDELTRDELNFQDAAEIPLTGDLTTAIKVAHPIQEFIPYFERYLETIK